jgi:ATP-binding cassette, subfamily B, bacterial
MTESKPRRLARLAAIMFFDGFRAAPGWMALVTALLVLGSVAGTCYPLGYRLLVDGTLAGNAAKTAAGVAVVAVLLGLAWVLTAIGATEAMALSDRIAVYRTGKLIELISGVPGLEHLERPDYLTQVEQLNAGRRQLAAAPRQLLSNVSSAARIIALLVLLGSVSPWLLLLPVTAAPPLIADRLAKKITKRSQDAMATDRRLADMVFDLSASASAAGELRCYGLAPHLAAEHARLTNSLDHRAAAEARRVLAVQAAGWLLYAAGLMAAIAFVVVRASDGALSLGTVLMTVSLIRRSRAQLASAASGSGALIGTLATADRLLWLEDHHAAARAGAGKEQAPARLRSGITLRHLSFSYPGTERTVLTDLSLFLPAGATVAVVGENGSGKTTLVKLLLGLYGPTSGSIVVDDTELAAIAGDAWRSRCTAAFQDFSRFSLPAVESVGVADLPSLESEPLALAALDRAGAAELAGQLPSGLATYVGGPYTGGHNLSGGQWQKLALGRAMRSPEPLLVVLDEPTAALDPHAEQALFERYAAASAAYEGTAGTITLLVSHRFATVRMADLIIYLEAGGAVEAGTHDELMETGGRYAELFTLQAQGYRLVHPAGLDTHQIGRYSNHPEGQPVMGAMQRCKRKPGVSACWPESRPRSQRVPSQEPCPHRRLRRRSPLRPR